MITKDKWTCKSEKFTELKAMLKFFFTVTNKKYTEPKNAKSKWKRAMGEHVCSLYWVISLDDDVDDENEVETSFLF